MPRVTEMKTPKKNSSIGLEIQFGHPMAPSLAAAMVTEAEHTIDGDSLSVFLESRNFTDLRAMWNSVMRALIASDESLGIE